MTIRKTSCSLPFSTMTLAGFMAMSFTDCGKHPETKVAPTPRKAVPVQIQETDVKSVVTTALLNPHTGQVPPRS